MKKIIAFILAFAMLALVLAGCGGEAKTVKKFASIDEVKTFGDIIDGDFEALQQCYYENTAVYVFKFGDNYYRAVSAISDELTEDIFDLDHGDDDYDKKEYALIKDIKIEKLENLNKQKLTDDQLKALVGKTGADLLNEGWTNSSGYNLEEMVFWMDYGPFMYDVYFEGKVDEADYEDFDEIEDIKELVVKSVEFNSLGGSATDIEMEE